MKKSLKKCEKRLVLRNIVCYNTDVAALTCEVADTLRCVVMTVYGRGIRSERIACQEQAEGEIHGKE